ncbi:hypothetical protein [Alloactinosynnema sp. L-07]|nr:hypothetical protein [Alloactinosynnema sp. L-07]
MCRRCLVDTRDCHCRHLRLVSWLNAEMPIRTPSRPGGPTASSSNSYAPALGGAGACLKECNEASEVTGR